MERKYGNHEEALTVAKEAVFLAWRACGGPLGMGVFQDRGPGQSKDAVWNQAYHQLNYASHNGRPEDVHADYVFGRMMKLYFKVDGTAINHSDSECRRDYQAWCGKYPTYAELFDAAEQSVKIAATNAIDETAE